jgi:hypothetical protein
VAENRSCGILIIGTAGPALVKVSLPIRRALTPPKRLVRDGGSDESGPCGTFNLKKKAEG